MNYKKQIIQELSFFSIISNIFLFIIKLYAGIQTNSIALIADAWHTLGDSLSSLAVFIGAILSAKAPDENHPFGHARYELIITFVISGMLIFIAGDFFIAAVKKFFLETNNSTKFAPIFLYASIISVIVKELMARITLYYHKKTNSKMLKTDAFHHRSDALSSLLLIIGYFLYDKIPYIDSLLGIIISIFIFKTAIEIISSNSSQILGEKIPENIEISIQEISNDIFGTELNMHHFHFHDYITHKELTFHINLENNTTLIEAHKIASILENEIKIKLNIDTTIHMEPTKKV